MPADRSGRRSVIEDLARGDLIHTEIARKYGRSVQGIRQFSSRNHTEVSRRRAVLQGELNAATADQWVTERPSSGICTGSTMRTWTPAYPTRISTIGR